MIKQAAIVSGQQRRIREAMKGFAKVQRGLSGMFDRVPVVCSAEFFS